MPVVKTQIICQIKLGSDKVLKIFYKNMKYEIDARQLCKICYLQTNKNLFHFLWSVPFTGA